MLDFNGILLENISPFLSFLAAGEENINIYFSFCCVDVYYVLKYLHYRKFYLQHFFIMAFILSISKFVIFLQWEVIKLSESQLNILRSKNKHYKKKRLQNVH